MAIPSLSTILDTMCEIVEEIRNAGGLSSSGVTYTMSEDMITTARRLRSTSTSDEAEQEE